MKNQKTKLSKRSIPKSERKPKEEIDKITTNIIKLRKLKVTENLKMAKKLN